MKTIKELVWEKGPLGFPTTPNWKYWTPGPTDDGKFLAWYYPRGLPGDGQELLGEFSSLEEAQRVCAAHQHGRVVGRAERTTEIAKMLLEIADTQEIRSFVVEQLGEEADEEAPSGRDLHLEAAASELGLTYKEAQERLWNKDLEVLQSRQRCKIRHFYERQLAAGCTLADLCAGCEELLSRKDK